MLAEFLSKNDTGKKNMKKNYTSKNIDKAHVHSKLVWLLNLVNERA
jgi:hypothetical protein